MTIRKGQQWPPYDQTRDVKQLQRDVKQLQVTAKGSEYYEYDPAWSALTTPPVQGAAVMDAEYRRDGSKCEVKIELTMGADTTFGTGNWTFALPFPVRAPANGNAFVCGGSAFTYDSSGAVAFPGIVLIEVGLQVTTLWCKDNAFGVSATTPFTWAVNDLCLLDFSYRVAEGY